MEDKLTELEKQGYCTIESFITDPSIIKGLNSMLKGAETSCQNKRDSNDLKNGTGTIHHIPATAYRHFTLNYTDFLLSLEKLDALFTAYFNGKYILNSFGGVINHPGEEAYLHKWHKDIRSVPGQMQYMINILVMLTDFTEENGATYVVPRSHEYDDPKTLCCTERLYGKAGDLVLFNSALLHKAGVNTTDSKRNCLTLTLSKPFLKPQFDYCDLYLETNLRTYFNSFQPRSYKFPTENGYFRQLIGYNSRTPQAIEEWYVPASERMYREDQE